MDDPTKTGFLEEAPGERSMMRLLCVQSWWAALGFGIAAAVTGNETCLTLSIVHLAVAILGKGSQKIIEMLGVK